MPSRHPFVPALVDPRGPRLGAALTTLVLAAALATGWAWLLVLQAVVFALGAAGRSPYGVLYARLVRPRLGPPAELEDTRPLRFAQAVGLVFTAVALVGLAESTGLVTLVATAFALAAAFLNAAFGVCLGCEAYLLLRRSNPIARTVPNPRAATPTRTEVPA
jgi:dipeptide/tripeptide permease